MSSCSGPAGRGIWRERKGAALAAAFYDSCPSQHRRSTRQAARLLYKRRTIFKIGLPPFDGLGKVVLVDICQASRLVVCKGKGGEVRSGVHSGRGARAGWRWLE